ncbi:MAG TPA: VOC family protein [Gammaproteobacteria bacterium]|nr:VOC family protein [Gammaproteobacteria bacterium]
MHHSRLSQIFIDCLDENFEECLAFWSAAFGCPPPRQPRKGQRYVTLKKPCPGHIGVSLQRVERDPGVHLDFESDSVAKESARMEAAGARRKYRIKSWWVMEDPSGNAFCVVRKQQPGPLTHAMAWPDGEGAA